MQRYHELKQSWEKTEATLSSTERNNLYTLFSYSDEYQVSSSFDLLLSYGEEALCAILELKGPQLALREDRSFPHPNIWVKCILDEIRLESSPWYPLYRANMCHQLMLLLFRHLEGTPYESLKDWEKNFLYDTSLISASISKGSFIMGALDHDGEAYDNEYQT